MSLSESHVLWLAALLHDIGKFGERTSDPLPTWAHGYRAEAKYTHEPFGAVFVDDFMGGFTDDIQTLRRLVLKHHTPSLPDELLVSLADRLSANERAEAQGDEEGARGRAESVLRTVLSRVQLDRREADACLYHELTALSLDRRVLIPNREASGSSEAYRTLWQAFAKQVVRAPRGDCSTLLAVLRKFTWAIPSDTRRDVIPDISLYHHLKTTAAIVACLAREALGAQEVETLHTALTNLFKKEPLTPSEESLVRRNLCALVKGDISGTQDFLYLLTSSGAARGLRGRSFYLQLLSETIADWILRQLDLPPTNLLFAGGGHFYLLLPHGDTTERLDDLQQQIARKLWKAHKGDLYLTVDYASVTTLDFLEGEAGGNAFAGKWEEVSRRVNELKQRKWRDLGGEAMTRNLFSAQQRGTTAEDTCQVCHNEGTLEVEEGVRKCKHCRQFEELGRLLRDPTYLVIFAVPEVDQHEYHDWRDVLRAFGNEVCLVREGGDVPSKPSSATAATAYTFDSTDFLTENVLGRFCWSDLPTSYEFRLLADATPKKRDARGESVIAEFGDLAEASDGVKWLGVLRMDVDSLGDVFKRGLGKDATISRISTLSESLRLFFEGWVPQLCRQYNFFNPATGDGEDKLYLIYAGGDDLFVVGAWSALPDLAKQIRGEFRAFVGGDHVTLSGGVAIEHQKFPLYQLANDAKHALDDQAKEFRRPNGGRPKDALGFLQTAMGWEQFAEVAQWKGELVKMLSPQGDVVALPHGFLTRLIEIYALYADNGARKSRLHRREEMTLAQMKEVIHYDKWQWRLIYQLSRFGERYKDYKDRINELQQAIVRDREGLISVLHVLARWTDLLRREG